MRKLIISGFLLALPFIDVSAECVVSVYNNSGQKVSYALSSLPSITTSDNKVIITTSSETLTYSFVDFGKLVTEEGSPTNPNSLEEIKVSDPFEDGKECYSLDGEKVLDVKSAKPGVYVVKSGNSSVIILKNNRL